MCYNSCNECPRKIFSDDVSIVAVGTVANLVIDVPAQSFTNCQRGCLVIVQNIPVETTITAPVSISIGGDTTTLYPLIDCRGVPVTAAQLRTRRRYPFRVNVNATSSSFTILKNLSCAANNGSDVIPVAEGG